MRNQAISGLVVSMGVGEVLHVSRKDGHAVAMEISLMATMPESLSAILAISVGGEGRDIEKLGLSTSRIEATITTIGPTEVVPGIRIALRASYLRRYVSNGTASLVVNADPLSWLIERETVLEDNISHHARQLRFMPDNGGSN
jgi:hypothetical protein